MFNAFVLTERKPTCLKHQNMFGYSHSELLENIPKPFPPKVQDGDVESVVALNHDRKQMLRSIVIKVIVAMKSLINLC